jgi:predicted HicB family RNase H-like nuclease
MVKKKSYVWTQVRVPDQLHMQLKAMAALERKSLETLIIDAMTEKLNRVINKGE